MIAHFFSWSSHHLILSPDQITLNQTMTWTERNMVRVVPPFLEYGTTNHLLVVGGLKLMPLIAFLLHQPARIVNCNKEWEQEADPNGPCRNEWIDCCAICWCFTDHQLYPSISLSLPLYLQIIWPLLRSDPAVSSLTLAIIRHSTRHSSAPDGESVTYRNKCGKLNESAISGSGRNR